MLWTKTEEGKNELFLYAKTFRFTVGIINKSCIIPTEDSRSSNVGPNDIENIDEAAEINFAICPKKQKELYKK